MQNICNRVTRTQDSIYYIRPIYPRVNTVRNSFQYKFATIWNELPFGIQEIGDSKKFSKALMTHLLEKY